VTASSPAELCEACVRGHDHARIAERTERLGGLEAEATQCAKIPGGAPAKARTEGLRGVLDQRHAVSFRDLRQALDTPGLAVQLDAQDRACARTDGRLDRLGIELERIVANVDEARPRTDP